MKIKELELNNFRGFEHLKIEFPDNKLAVFIGTNGSGKSSVLDALGMFLTKFMYKLIGKSINNIGLEIPKGAFIISKKDITIDLKKTTNNINVSSKNRNWHWTLYKSDDNSQDNEYSDDNNLDMYIHEFNLNSNESVPILVYYQTNRIVSVATKEDSKVYPHEEEISSPKLFTYKKALVPSLSQFKDFVYWFKKTEDVENRQKIKRQTLEYRDERLETIRAALSSFLDYLTDENYKNLRIENSDTIAPFSFEFVQRGFGLMIEKNGQEFEVNQLSDGEKTLIMLVCDIARRLTIANPSLKNKLEGEGVVMIDEIELHLHPKWQRNVLPALQKTFPNIQFIVTTHSPQVLGGVERESVFILKDFKLQEYKPYTKGRDSNSILLDVMGADARDNTYAKKLDELAKLLDDENKDEAYALLDKLKEDLGARDSEITRIETIMHFFED